MSWAGLLARFGLPLLCAGLIFLAGYFKGNADARVRFASSLAKTVNESIEVRKKLDAVRNARVSTADVIDRLHNGTF